MKGLAGGEVLGRAGGGAERRALRGPEPGRRRALPDLPRGLPRHAASEGANFEEFLCQWQEFSLLSGEIQFRRNLENFGSSQQLRLRGNGASPGGAAHLRRPERRPQRLHWSGVLPDLPASRRRHDQSLPLRPRAPGMPGLGKGSADAASVHALPQLSFRFPAEPRHSYR